MSMMAAETAGENRGGKKIAGMPRNVVIIGVVALVGGIAWFYYKRKQSGASSSSGGASGGQIIGYDANGNPIYSGSATTPADFSGELSTLQSEFGSLAAEIAALQGGQPPQHGPIPTGSGEGGPHRCPGGAHWDASKGKCVFGAGEGPKPKPKKKGNGGPPGPPPKPGMIWSGAEHKWLTSQQWHAAHVAHQKKVKAKT